jgi:uncharacterized repeat protein (TIGR02543 family)
MLEEPPNPSLLGYSLDGWYADAAFTIPWDFDDIVSSDNITLYARWTANTYTVTLDPQSGTGGTASVTATYAAAMPAATAPTRTGYTFAGYYDAASGGTQYYTAAMASSRSWNKTAATTLYARWTANTYTVAYNANGGSGATASSSHTYDQAKALTANAFARSGYTFAGWAATASGSIKYTDGQSVTNLSSSQGATVTLYAVWQTIVYALAYVFNGGADPGNAAAYTIESPPVPLHPSTFRGYAFQGWYDNAAFSGSPIDGIPTGSIGDRTYYAKWQAIVYTISYALNGGTQNPDNPTTYTIESPDIVFNAPTRRGYAFTGWRDNSGLTGSPDTGIPAGSIGDRAYFAGWNPIIYRISYELAGGANSPGNPPEYTVAASTIPLQDPQRRGYAFKGWYDSPDFSGEPATSIPHDSIGDRTFWAKWEAIVYPIEYVLSGGENNPGNPASYTVESPDIPLLTPESPGYSFAGWFDNAGFINAPIARISAASTGAVKFFARWTRGVTFPTGKDRHDRFSGSPMIFL